METGEHQKNVQAKVKPLPAGYGFFSEAVTGQTYSPLPAGIPIPVIAIFPYTKKDDHQNFNRSLNDLILLISNPTANNY
jgi:hypothetical protein